MDAEMWSGESSLGGEVEPCDQDGTPEPAWMEQARGIRPQVERTACTHMELYMVVKDGLLC